MEKPNIIYIYADDLGRGLLSCYGQQHYKTPNIDALCEKGIKFNRAYGCAFCAPARASLISGIHDCHAGRWSFTGGGHYERLGVDMSLEDIYELINNTGFSELDTTEFLPHILKKGGYFTGEIGKLEWGFATTEDDIKKHGWDYHYGYYDHQQCHGFYPPFLFENGKVINIKGNTHMDCGKAPLGESAEYSKIRHNREGKAQYSQDLFEKKIVEFLETHKNEKFFLYHPSQLPHGPIAVPEIHHGVKYNPELTEYEKEYASMVLRLDDTVGMIVKTLERLKLKENTIIIFSSDNGHEVYYDQDGRSSSYTCVRTGQLFDEIKTSFTTENANDVFNGNDGMRGKKRSNCEGGVRIPYIINWENHVLEGVETDCLIANYDLMPTLAEIANVKMPGGKDGISFLNALKRRDDKGREYVVYASHRGPGITQVDGWKLRYITETCKYELYNLVEDYTEENDLSQIYPEKVHELGRKLLKECDGNYNNGTPMWHRVDTLDIWLNKWKDGL